MMRRAFTATATLAAVSLSTPTVEPAPAEPTNPRQHTVTYRHRPMPPAVEPVPAGTSTASDTTETERVPADTGPCEASTYGWGEPLATHTANGALFDPDALTVAHRTLPFGTVLEIDTRDHTVTATVTDRGPAAWTGRCLDLARGTWQALHLGTPGLADVTFREVQP